MNSHASHRLPASPFPPSTPPGQYYVQYNWTGYYDVVDIGPGRELELTNTSEQPLSAKFTPVGGGSGELIELAPGASCTRELQAHMHLHTFDHAPEMVSVLVD